jgi:hypothetical protein
MFVRENVYFTSYKLLQMTRKQNNRLSILYSFTFEYLTCAIICINGVFAQLYRNICIVSVTPSLTFACEHFSPPNLPISFSAVHYKAKGTN